MGWTPAEPCHGTPGAFSPSSAQMHCQGHRSNLLKGGRFYLSPSGPSKLSAYSAPSYRWLRHPKAWLTGNLPARHRIELSKSQNAAKLLPPNLLGSSFSNDLLSNLRPHVRRSGQAIDFQGPASASNFSQRGGLA